MINRYVPQRRALSALIQVYAPSRKVRIISWDADYTADSARPDASAKADVTAADRTLVATAATSGTSDYDNANRGACDTSQHATQDQAVGTVNTCNSLRLDEPDLESAESARKLRRLDEKRQRKSIWMGSVVEALSDVFTAIWANFVEPTEEFQTAALLRPGATKAASNANLVSSVFSSEKIMAARESYRIHFHLMQAFQCGAALSDWQSNPAVNAYVVYLKADPMIRECCLGLFSRLGTTHFERVDQFVETLRQVWFQPVASSSDRPRCGYHHVCIGDFFPKSKTLSGMHNWFKFLIEEERRRTRILKWRSYEKDLHLVSMSFSMRHPTSDVWYTKSTSSFLVGVPIDFELLLFTVITMVNPNKDTTVHIRDYEPLVVVPRCLKKTGSVVTAYFRESPQQHASD